MKYSFTSDVTEFQSRPGPKINYSREKPNSGLTIHPAGIMMASHLSEIELGDSVFNEHPVLFATGNEADLPYDPVASIFYMVSRYEEYLPHEKDGHDRYKMESSVAFKLKFNHLPIVHYWATDIIDALRKKYPETEIVSNHYRFIPSFDIDNAYAFRHKGLIRTAGALVRSMLTNWSETSLRFKVMARRAEDPYDNYDYIDEINLDFGVKPVYFILTSSTGRYDRNIDPQSKAFGDLLKKLRNRGKIGLHPSHRSGSLDGLLEAEKELLGRVAGTQIKLSRQHFLKLILPDTYEKLISVGITDDHSMGWAGASGFRAGICVPYPFYNLTREREEKLMIHPFCFMEATYVYYRKTDAEAVKEEIRQLVAEVRKVNGCFIPVWHNESLGEWDKWKGWKEVFEYMYEEASV